MPRVPVQCARVRLFQRGAAEAMYSVDWNRDGIIRPARESTRRSEHYLVIDDALGRVEALLPFWSEMPLKLLLSSISAVFRAQSRLIVLKR